MSSGGRAGGTAPVVAGMTATGCGRHDRHPNAALVRLDCQLRVFGQRVACVATGALAATGQRRGCAFLQYRKVCLPAAAHGPAEL